MAKDWIKGAVKRPGAFTRKAKAHGMGVKCYATKVIREYKRHEKHTPAQTRTYRQAVLARTFEKMAKKKRRN